MASRREAQMAYHLGLHPLVNSPWLQQMLQPELPGIEVQLVPNAIDHQVFTGKPCIRSPDEPLRLISYGGRSAQWKGFEQMCQALALVKTRNPDLRFEWSVYGDSLLPPDNSICPYRPLGFLKPADLAQAYRSHHVLLSASWYESFPLFPIEAMACGLAAITTQPGTELFAEHQRTAWVVPPRDPQALADAIVQLARDEPLRQRLAAQGQARSRDFTWERAGEAMEAALKHIDATPLATNPAD
jgi:glycosyltransferase involved in cell wall biosynthesis